MKRTLLQFLLFTLLFSTLSVSVSASTNSSNLSYWTDGKYGNLMFVADFEGQKLDEPTNNCPSIVHLGAKINPAYDKYSNGDVSFNYLLHDRITTLDKNDLWTPSKSKQFIRCY